MRCAMLLAWACDDAGSATVMLLFFWRLGLALGTSLRLRMTRGTGVTAGSAVMLSWTTERLVLGAVAGASLHR